MAATAVFLGLPLLLWSLGDFPRRSILKEFLSLLSILAFCQMIGLFFLTRSNKSAVEFIKMSTVLKFHKIIGYISVGVLLIHPFLLVFPRYFESGVDPIEAFMTIITTLNSKGILMGLVAWCSLLLLGVTSLFQSQIPLEYTTWRAFHGVLAMVVLFVSSLHVLNLGRHSNLAMSIYFIILAISGELLILKTYRLELSKAQENAKGNHNDEKTTK